MAKQTKTYHGIDNNEFQQIRKMLSENGIVTPDSPSGTVSGPYGFTVSWNLYGTNLSVTLDGSWLLMGTAFGKIDDGIKPFVQGA